MLERFTDRARRVVKLAEEEARMLNHNYIGTEHILLGLIHEGEGVAAKALESLGISLDAVRQQVEEIIGQGQQIPSGRIPFTPRAKKVLELSLREALQLGHDYIGTEHILLGLIREGDGVAAQVLIRLGADLNRVRQQVIGLLYQSKEPRLAPRPAEEGAPLPEVQARLDAVEDWLAVVEQRVGTGPDTSDLDEQIDRVRRERLAAANAQEDEQAAALRREGADFVVAVAHVTREQGYQIFRGRAVDLLLTGHTHDLFIEYSGRTAMVESSYDAHYVTAIDIVIDVSEESGRRRVRWWPQFRVIDTAMAMPDPEVAAVVAQFEDELNKGLDAPIGTTAVELDSRAATVRTREAAIGNLIADAMRWSAQTEVAVINAGAIRSDMIYPAGTTITRREVLAALPFDNRLVTIDVSGSALKAAIENGLSRLPAPSGRFPQVAGLKIEADPSRPAGNRVLSIKVGDTPLDANKTYSVATIDFMARGGDDYISFRDAKPVLPPADSPTIAYEVIDYIKSVGTIRTAVDGRIVLS